MWDIDMKMHAKLSSNLANICTTGPIHSKFSIQM